MSIRKESQGKYTYVYDPKNPMSDYRGRVLEHRYVMSEYLGRPLLGNELVHHKNGDKKDNRIVNLELMSRSQHTSSHNKKEEVLFVCPICLLPFSKLKSRIRTENPTCSRSCAAKKQIKEGNYPSGNKKSLSHGAESGYRRGCRCFPCKEAHNERCRMYMRNKLKK